MANPPTPESSEHAICTPHTRQLLHGETTTLEAALSEEHDMIHQLSYCRKRLDFLRYLTGQQKELETYVACHLGLEQQNGCCRLSRTAEWIHGSFKLCVPVEIDKTTRRPAGRVILRFPLPYKIGESNFPGNSDEKLRCEVATYAWIQRNCPDVPIPRLFGFAFSNGRRVSYNEAKL